MVDIIADMKKLYEKYGFFDDPMTVDKLNFRQTLLTEEYAEITDAISKANAEELVDGYIDIVVIAVGTLLLLGVDVERAWKSVLEANMAKERGVKSTRPGSMGFDLIKPEGWKAPDHTGNHGVLDEFAA